MRDEGLRFKGIRAQDKRTPRKPHAKDGICGTPEQWSFGADLDGEKSLIDRLID